MDGFRNSADIEVVFNQELLQGIRAVGRKHTLDSCQLQRKVE